MPQHQVPSVPFHLIADSTRKVYECILGHPDYPAYDKLPVLEQCAWEGAVRHMATLFDHDGEAEGPPNLSAYEGAFTPGWMPARLRNEG